MDRKKPEPKDSPWDLENQTNPPPTLAPVKHRKVMAHVRYFFTAAEIAEMAVDLAQAGITKAQLEEELTTIKANFKSDITIQEEHINKLMRQIHNGFEMRTVVCHEYRDYENKKVLTIRDDTGETVKERPMTLDETQHFIDFESPGEEAAANEAAATSQEEVGEAPPDPAEGEGDQSPPPPPPEGGEPGEVHP